MWVFLCNFFTTDFYNECYNFGYSSASNPCKTIRANKVWGWSYFAIQWRIKWSKSERFSEGKCDDDSFCSSHSLIILRNSQSFILHMATKKYSSYSLDLKRRKSLFCLLKGWDTLLGKRSNSRYHTLFHLRVNFFTKGWLNCDS